MSITNWKTWASGDTLTAADMNTYVRDNGRWLSHNATGGAPMCRVYNNADISTTDSTDKTLTFNSERFDVQSMHDTSSNTSRITIPSGGAGRILTGGHLLWALGSFDTLRRSISIKVNGATLIAVSTVPAVNNKQTYQSITTMYALAAADYLELIAYQESGGTLNVNASSNYSPEFWAIWIGE